MQSSRIVWNCPIPFPLILDPGGCLSMPLGVDAIGELLVVLRRLNYNRYRRQSPLQSIMFMYT